MSGIEYRAWAIATCDCTSELSRSLFFQGNGKVGMRAVCPLDKARGHEHGMFMAGCFETLHDSITDMVNLPDLLCMILSDKDPRSMHQSLDFAKGVLERTWETDNALYSYERVLSFSDRALLGHRLKVTAKRGFMLEAKDAIDADVVNLPVNDDQTKINIHTIKLIADVEMKEEGDMVDLRFSTACGTHSLHFSKHLEAGGSKWLEKGESWEIRSVASIDGRKALPCYDDMKRASAKALEAMWEKVFRFDDSDPRMASAIRFNIFCLMQNAPDQDISIGARGLSHGRYKGNYFWDAEIFMLPAYLKIMPEAARHILMFRCMSLDKAMENAAAMNLEGARYPWMCSTQAIEQCESWDTGSCEIHVTADVAWALDAYVKETGDLEFERSCAARVYKETARYWVSRFSYDKVSDCYQMLFVKGPDEYCGVTCNNTYTTMMAKHNIKLALDAARRGLVSLKPGEMARMKDILDKARIPYSAALGTYLEDDTYEKLEDFDLSGAKKDGSALYHRICFDRLQRLKVIKQPDVILLYILLPELFTEKQAQSAWLEYEKRTSHDSTLSWGMHAVAAFKLGRRKEGMDYLRKALFLDLENLMGNTASEGLHVGACGAAIQGLLQLL